MLNLVGFPFRFSDEIKRRREVQSHFNALCEKYGFEEIEAPIISPLEDVVGPSPLPLHPDNLNRVFHGVLFHEKKVTSGALRYESTTQIARLLTDLDFSKKSHYAFHYFQEMVRLEKDEEICKKRKKSFFQIGIENFATSHKDHLFQTTTVFQIILELLAYFNLKPKIRFSHTEIVLENFKKHNFEPILKRRIINLMEKGDFNKLQDVLTNLNLEKRAMQNLIKMAQLRNVSLVEGIEYVKSLGCEKAYIELQTVYDHLVAKGISTDVFSFDSGIHRSLNFYNGVVFQLDAGSMKEIAGGGDFSKLVKSFGPKEDIYSMGLAIGYERLLLAQQQEQLLC